MTGDRETLTCGVVHEFGTQEILEAAGDASILTSLIFKGIFGLLLKCLLQRRVGGQRQQPVAVLARGVEPRTGCLQGSSSTV